MFHPFLFVEDACSYSTVSNLGEYVLNTSGKIWVGSANSNYGRPWQFSQFNDNCLDVVLWILEKMKPKERGNPIMVGCNRAYVKRKKLLGQKTTKLRS